jgi:phosphopantothenoylcysteine decarboxylase/phosphopantothenate--cysteine ligase
MQQAIFGVLDRVDVVIMTAAIADYRPKALASEKLKKSRAELSLELVKNPDILATLGARRRGKRPILIGFAMETSDLARQARKKLIEKRADLIVANEASVGFGRDDTQAILVAPEGDEALAPSSKLDLAERILDRVRELLSGRPATRKTRKTRKPNKARKLAKGARKGTRSAPRRPARRSASRLKGRGSSRA